MAAEAAIRGFHSTLTMQPKNIPKTIRKSLAMREAADQISSLQGIAQSNSAFNAEQALLQRQWSEKQSAKAMAFNSSEAAKNRNWQEMMSNTAHQREVKDLMAAGLNPVLSAMNGNGAAVTSGATASGVVGSGSKADADTSTSGAIANLLGSILAAETQIRASNINARTQEAVADKYNAMSEIVANINAAAGIKQANIHAGATRYSAERSADAHRYAADKSLEGTKYSTDHTKYGMIGNALDGFINALFGGSDSDGSDGSSDSSVTSAKGATGNVFYDDPTWDSSLLGKFWNKHFRKKK